MEIKIDKDRCKEAIENGLKWMFSRQNLEEGKKYGSLHGEFIWHDAEAIRAFLSVYRRTKDKQLLERAKLTGDFLIRLQYKEDPEDRLYGCIETPAYTPKKIIAPSDIFEAIPGIIELYQETKDERYLNCDILASDWLIKHTQSENGVMGQLFDVERWENINPLPIHDEAGFLLLYQETKDEKYLKVFNEQVGVLLKTQNTLGTWYTHGYQLKFDIPSSGRTQYWYTYPILAAYKQFRKGTYLVGAIRGADRLLRIQLWDGSIKGGGIY